MGSISISKNFVLVLMLIVAVSNLSLIGIEPACAQNSVAPTLQWGRVYDGGGNIGLDYARFLVETIDGGYAFAAPCTPYSLTRIPPSTILTKTDSSGIMQWQKQFFYGFALGMAQTSDGGYVLAGQDNSYSGSFHSGFVLFKLDSNGNLQWNINYTYSGQNYPWTGCNMMLPTNDDGFAFAGTSANNDVWLMKTNSIGYVQWNKTYNVQFRRGVTRFIQTQNGDYVLIGPSIINPSSEGSPNTLVMVKINWEGKFLWSRTYNDGISSWEGQSITQTSDGGYVLTDNTNSSNTHVFFKTDKDGNLEWEQTYATNADADSRINSVTQTSDGGLAFVGFLQNPSGGVANIWLIKADSSGNIEWNQTYGYTSPNANLSGLLDYFDGGCIIESSDGGLVAAGAGCPGGNAYLAKYYMVKTQPFLPLPTPSPSSPAVPSSLPSPSSKPTVPEFPTWVILPPLIIVLVGVGLLLYSKKRKH